MSIGSPEVILVLIIALLVLGPDKLPNAARQVGKALAEFKRLTTDVHGQVHKFINEEPSTETEPSGAVAVEAPPQVPPSTEGFRLIEDKPPSLPPEFSSPSELSSNLSIPADPESTPADPGPSLSAEPATPWRPYEPDVEKKQTDDLDE